MTIFSLGEISKRCFIKQYERESPFFFIEQLQKLYVIFDNNISVDGDRNHQKKIYVGMASSLPSGILNRSVKSRNAD